MKLKLITYISLIILIFSINSFAGITGGIRGEVRDEETDEPIQGASVVLLDTNLGAITDAEGFFVITNIPVGKYSVKIMMMGYNPKKIEGVVVAMDHQTKLDEITLSETTLDIGTEVTVTAERQMLQQDVTATTHITKGEELNFMPVKDFKDAMKREPGVVGGHVRGGRESEVLYLIDDIPIQEAIYGETGANLPNSSVVEMSLQTGGFSAEYGNAMSGVVNVVTKEGRERTKAYLKMFTDYVGGDASNHLQKYEVNLGGPIFSREHSYFFSGDFTLSDTRFREHLEEALDSPVLLNYNFNGKIATHITPRHKLVLQGIVSHQKWTEYEHIWKYHLDGLPEKENNSYRISGTYTHTLSPRSFYKISLSQFYVMDQILGKNNGNFKPYLGKYKLVSEEPYNLKYFVDSEDGSGIVKPMWRDSEQIITIAKGDFTSQIARYTQMKAGAEFTYYDLYMNNVEYRLIHPDSILPGYPKDEAYSVYVTKYNYFPKTGAAYVQFKSEALEDVTLNYGMRMDFLEPTANRPAVEFDFDDRTGVYSPTVVENIENVEADVEYQFSPRFGVSMPVTDIDKISFNYGHFFQFPLFSYLYTNPNYDFSEGYNSLIGNPELKSEKTIAYEISWEHLFTEDMKADITYFNKDIENLIDKVTLIVETEDEIGATIKKEIDQYRNFSYGHSYGLEVYLEKRRGIEDWWDLPTSYLSGKVSYTWMKTQGSSSQFETKYDEEGRITAPPYEYYLSWDQRHTVVANLDYRVPEDWGINILYRFNSGKPYTPNEAGADPNSKRVDPTSYLDLKINKNFRFGGIATSFFVEGLNVLDTENILWVDGAGRAGGIYGDPTAYDTGRRINIGFTAEF